MSPVHEEGRVPAWVWVVVSIFVMGMLGAGGCLIGIGVLTSRGGGARAVSSSSPVTSTDDFVIVEADRTQQPEDVFRAAVVTASARGLTPFVYATASWCQPCQKLNRSMSDARMKDAFKGTYVVKLDIDAFGDKPLAAVGLRVRAVPSFYELGADGMPTGRNMIGDWGPDTPENMAPALKRFFAVSPR